MTYLVVFGLGWFLASWIVRKEFKENAHSIQSIEGHYKVVPQEWFWEAIVKPKGSQDKYWAAVDNLK